MTSHPPSNKWSCSHLCKKSWEMKANFDTGKNRASTSWCFYEVLSQPPNISPWETFWTKDGFYLLNKCNRSPLHVLAQPASEPRSAFRIHNILWQRVPQLIMQQEEPSPFVCFEPALYYSLILPSSRKQQKTADLYPIPSPILPLSPPDHRFHKPFPSSCLFRDRKLYTVS